MNTTEVYEIKKTWEIPSANPGDTGVAILLKFFEKYPNNMQKFSKFKDMEMSALNDYARFKSHATSIMKVFDDSIQALGYDWSNSRLEEMWTKLAESHFKLKVEQKQFNEIKEVILDVLGTACNLNEEQTEAWIKFFDLIYSILFNALDKIKNGEI